MKLFISKCKSLLDTSESQAYERLQDATRILARRISEAEFPRHMANFYDDRASQINPYESVPAAFAYASAKHQERNYREDYRYCIKRIEEAEAKVNARRTQLQQLTHNAAQ